MTKPKSKSSPCVPVDQCSCGSSPNIVYHTSFAPDHDLLASCSNQTQRVTNPFTAYDPACIKCITKNADKATIENNVLHVRFPPSVGSSSTFWTRIGTAALSSCSSASSCGPDPATCSKTSSCCPALGSGVRKGYLDAWVFFPAEDASLQNRCNWNETRMVKRTFPFYHGGKLFGVCSSQCPTGNSKTPAYNQDWTIRLMFREGGRLVLLYSVPADKPYLLSPVAPQLQACCPNGDCASFTSASTDQYWYATKDTSLHPFRLAEYTMNSTADATCCTAYEWPGGVPNPIQPVLEGGKWNFLRMKWDIDRGTVQVYHAIDLIGSTPSQAPAYTPQPDALVMVINTPPFSIPFPGAQPVKSLYFQPFFGGSQNDWLPVPLNDCNDPVDPSTVTPVFSFGDLMLYQE